MQPAWVFAIVGALTVPLCSQTPATTADLAFLAGCWKLESNGRVVEEHWLAPAGGSLMGVSVRSRRARWSSSNSCRFSICPRG